MNEKYQYLDDIVRFLSIVHPNLTTNDRNCVEIRPILREEEYSYDIAKSLNLFALDEANIKRLNEFLLFHQEHNTCIYYSIYTYDFDKKSMTKSGKPAMKGKITTESALFTEEIVLDFDDMDKPEYVETMVKLLDFNIEALWVFTGHGYHAHILLNEKVYDKNVLYNVVMALKARGFKVDVNCTDAARVMRLPYTDNKKKEPHIFSEVVEENITRYSLEELYEKIGIEYNPEDKELNSEIKTISYPFINNLDMPEAIKKMLGRTNEGYRNLVLGFLIKYFKQYYKFSKTQIHTILYMWAKDACNPSYVEEFEASFERLYLSGGLIYNSKLASEYGTIDFDNYVKIQKKRDIFIPNNILKNLDIIDGKQLRAYLAIKMLEHIDKPLDIGSIAEVLGITERALSVSLKELIRLGFVYKTKGNRTLGEKYRYNTTKIFEISMGYTKLSYGDLNYYLDKLNGNELKLYLFMGYKCFESGVCFISQKNLGNYLNLKQNTISTIIKNLDKKYFITVKKNFITSTIYNLEYTLLM